MGKLLPEKAFNKVVAAQVAHAPEMLAKAEEAKAAILVFAAAHNKTGHYAGKIAVRPANRVDYEVAATDPAAAHIEFGHELSGAVPNDAMVGVSKTTLRRGKRWVLGLHIVRNGAIAVGGVVDGGV